MRVGNWTVSPISDGTFVARASYFNPKAANNARPDLFDRPGGAWLPIGCFVIAGVDGRVVLVDAGLGPELQRLPDGMLLVGGQLLTGLSGIALTPDDITDVVCTHLHADHIGWIFDLRGQAIFPSATVWCGAADLQIAEDLKVSAHARAGFASRLREAKLRPMRDTVSIAPGVTAVPAPGHTPGSYLVEVRSRAERLLLIGDAITCPAQLDETDWHSFGDINPDQAQRTRTAILSELADGHTGAIGAHFPLLRPMTRGADGRFVTSRTG